MTTTHEIKSSNVYMGTCNPTCSIIDSHQANKCVVYVLIAPPQQTKMGPQRRMRIYRGENKKLENNINWNELSLSHLDPCTKEYELEVQKIIYLQNLANQLLNVFSDPKRVTKSYILGTNALIRIDVLVGQSNITNDF
ncbi:hypothetical protein CR513_57992, partial [Mucuna pruriens]